jgi:hypothetical protein
MSDEELATELRRIAKRASPAVTCRSVLLRAATAVAGSATPMKCRWCGHPIYRQRTGWTHGPHRDSRRSCCNGQRVAEPAAGDG